MADIKATPNHVLNSIAARLLQRAEANCEYHLSGARLIQLEFCLRGHLTISFIRDGEDIETWIAPTCEVL
jgi:hypothetical protein